MLPSEPLLPANSLSELSPVIAGVAGVGAASALAGVSPKLSPVFVVDARAIASGLSAPVLEAPA